MFSLFNIPHKVVNVADNDDVVVAQRKLDCNILQSFTLTIPQRFHKIFQLDKPHNINIINNYIINIILRGFCFV